MEKMSKYLALAKRSGYIKSKNDANDALELPPKPKIAEKDVLSLETLESREADMRNQITSMIDELLSSPADPIRDDVKDTELDEEIKVL